MSSAIPQDTLNKQICSECAKYLSVGLVVVSPEGDLICGRCPRPRKATISLYNLISENISFRCIYHHSGCKELLRMAETAPHETVCKNKEEFYYCPLCDFKGNGCQLFSHFGTLHENSIIKGGSLEEILSYSHLKNFVDSILNMGNHRLRLFIRMAVKMFSVCCRCNKQFDESCLVYVCPQYHLLCKTCFKSGCLKCNVPCEFNNRTELHYILLECEWPGCCEKKNVFQYISHKQQCKYRLHKCPSKKCEYVGLLESLKQHWHLNDLISGPTCSLAPNVANYWLIPRLNEIVYVTCYYTPDYRRHSVVVDEKDLISPFSLQCGQYEDSEDNYDYSIVFWKYKPLRHAKHSTVSLAASLYVKKNLTGVST